jgi:hypothetical protein
LRLQPLQQSDELIVDEKRRGASVVDCVGDLFGRQTDIHRLQHGAHHRDCKERLKKAVAVPVEDAHGVAGHDPRFAQGRSETADPLPDLAIGEAPQIAVNHLLIRRLHERRVPQLLEDERILISGLSGLNQPSNHGGLPRLVSLRHFGVRKF